MKTTIAIPCQDSLKSLLKEAWLYYCDQRGHVKFSEFVKICVCRHAAEFLPHEQVILLENLLEEE